jgi:hypothetical protein
MSTTSFFAVSVTSEVKTAFNFENSVVFCTIIVRR